jgi:hypothetical protein
VVAVEGDHCITFYINSFIIIQHLVRFSKYEPINIISLPITRLVD